VFLLESGEFDAGTLAPNGTLSPSGQRLDQTTVNFFEAVNSAPFNGAAGQSPGSLLGEVNGLGGNFAILGFNGADPQAPPPNGVGVNSAVLAVQVTAVPEPTTVALLGLGLSGLAGWRWRRRV
jgi:hypothetical protein